MTNEQALQFAHGIGGLDCLGKDHGMICQKIQTAIKTAAEAVALSHAAIAEDLRNQAANIAAQVQARGLPEEAARHANAAQMAELLRRLILLPADGCRVCLNSRQVPSKLVPGAMTKCLACTGQEPLS
jgi:hypothetical protein